LVDFLAHPPSARQVGKLNFYLEALDRDVRKAHEHPSIGVLLCASNQSQPFVRSPREEYPCCPET
jgi:hypothetical protein